MALHYGMNITASDMKRLLEENDKLQSGVRSWRQLFGNASLGYEAQSGALRSDYSSAISEAYKSNLAQQNALMASGLSTGATKEMIGASRRDLQNAYDTYIRNYNTNASTLAENYNAEVSSINQALTERATNFANLYSSAYKYLSEELAGSSFTNPAGETIDVLTDQALDWLYAKDAQGNPTQDLMAWNDLSYLLFDSNAVMTDRGREFYDAMFNLPQQEWQTAAGERTRTFDEWLSQQSDTFENYDAANLPGMAKTGKDLRDWWASQDEFNYAFAGTNAGTAQTNIGLDSVKRSAGKQETPTNNITDKKGTTQKLSDFNVPANTLREAMGVWRQIQGTTRVPADIIERERIKLRNAGTTYADTVSNELTKLDKLFKTKFGENEYDRFYTINKSLYQEYKDLVNKMKSATMYDYESYITKFGKLYEELLSKMNTYSPEQRVVTSGF